MGFKFEIDFDFEIHFGIGDDSGVGWGGWELTFMLT